MYSWRKYNEISLLNSGSPYNCLKEQNNCDKEHAKKIWNIFSIKNIDDIYDVYVKSDNSFLTEIFENFRDAS